VREERKLNDKASAQWHRVDAAVRYDELLFFSGLMLLHVSLHKEGIL
jgi:hypothetical protein